MSIGGYALSLRHRQRREQWQLHDLSAPAKRLLDMVDAAGKLRLDQIPGTHDLKRCGPMLARWKTGSLVIADDVHTESGKHVKRIETWQKLAMRAKLAPPKISGAEARSQLEDVCSKLAAEFGTTAALPWQPAKNARAKVTAQ